MNYIYFENGLLFDFAQSDNVPIETNTCYWNKFQTSNYLSFLRNFLSKSTFFLQTFCFYEAKTSFKLMFGINSKPQIIYRSYGTSFQNLHFSYKPFASTKQKHLLNSNVWNKFQTSNYLSFLRNFLSKSTFFLQTFCFYEAIFKINF